MMRSEWEDLKGRNMMKCVEKESRQSMRKGKTGGREEYQREYRVQYDDLLRHTCRSHGAGDTRETYDLN